MTDNNGRTALVTKVIVTHDEYHNVRLTIGNQTFSINSPQEDEEHALWTKKFLIHALRQVLPVNQIEDAVWSYQEQSDGTVVTKISPYTPEVL